VRHRSEGGAAGGPITCTASHTPSHGTGRSRRPLTRHTPLCARWTGRRLPTTVGASEGRGRRITLPTPPPGPRGARPVPPGGALRQAVARRWRRRVTLRRPHPAETERVPASLPPTRRTTAAPKRDRWVRPVPRGVHRPHPAYEGAALAGPVLMDAKARAQVARLRNHSRSACVHHGTLPSRSQGRHAMSSQKRGGSA
jgi:hypothetical protein